MVPFMLIAHRGANHVAPENTRSAFDAALSLPIDGIEFDAQMTNDRVPIICHDETTQTINGKRKRISAYSYDELKAIDWGKWFSEKYSGEKILTLDEVLKRYGKRTKLFIEIKSYRHAQKRGTPIELTEQVVQLTQKLIPKSVRGNIFFLSFDNAILDHAYKKAPGWNYILNIHDPLSACKNNVQFPPYLVGVCCNIRKLTMQISEFIHQQRKLVATYACNNRRQIDKAIQLKAGIIMTDKPDWAVHFISSAMKKKGT